jgi:hypothetical protein
MFDAGQDLHAPLVERLIELPMDISSGRISGDLRLRAYDSKTWHFPSFGGRLRCMACVAILVSELCSPAAMQALSINLR